MYANNNFNNSIIIENVLIIVEEEYPTDAFLNLINDRLNGILSPLDKTLIEKAIPISNSFSVSFCNLFDAQHIFGL